MATADLDLASHDPSLTVPALTDLSAVYLARFAMTSDPLDLLRSVQASERGLRRAPKDRALLFNRALALSDIGTTILAKQAWARFLTVETDRAWRKEAASRLTKVGPADSEEEWLRIEPILRSPHLEAGELEKLVRRWPAQTRRYVEEILLPRWAELELNRERAAANKSLRIAEAIGLVLARDRGEQLLSEALISIHNTMKISSPQLQRDSLLSGLRDFGYGLEQYNEQNLTSARTPLLKAMRNLHLVRNPLAYWARFYLAIGEYYANANRGLSLLKALLREIPCKRFPALTGRAEWIAGTIDKVQGRLQSSVVRYIRSKNALERSGGDSEAAFVAVLLAESYSLLGEHSLGWQERSLAFQHVPLSEGPRRNIAMWIEAKQALLRQGKLDLAGPFVEEAVALANRWGRPLGLATAYLDRSAYLNHVGARQGALADLRTAQRAIRQLEESPLKKQMSALALIIEGLCKSASRPEEAALFVRQGLHQKKGTGNRFEAIDYTVALGAAQLAAGEVRNGTSSFSEAIALFEQIRSTVEDPVSRMQAFRQAQPAFDALIRLQVSPASGNREAAFRLAERSRARVLLELRASRSKTERRKEHFVTLAELEQNLPAGVTLVSYAALEDRTLAWVVRRGEVRIVRLEEGREELLRAIERLRLEMARRAPEKLLQKASEPLFDLLIRPLRLDPKNARSVVIAPDRWLARLPFAALFDRDTHKYFVETTTLTTTPSASLFMQAPWSASSVKGPELPVLSVGVGRGGRFSGQKLPDLQRAAQEAIKVATYYSQPRLLLGSDATKENFLRLSVLSRVVHFAGHAIADLESPGRSVLLFQGKGIDTLEPLSLSELLALGFGNVQLVVLSACRTQDGLADDREGLLGLAGAFFAAGVPEVVASPWDIRDRSAEEVMTALHRHYRVCRSAGIAFRQSVLELRRRGSISDRSPATWGGFTVISTLFHQEDSHLYEH